MSTSSSKSCALQWTSPVCLCLDSNSFRNFASSIVDEISLEKLNKKGSSRVVSRSSFDNILVEAKIEQNHNQINRTRTRTTFICRCCYQSRFEITGFHCRWWKHSAVNVKTMAPKLLQPEDNTIQSLFMFPFLLSSLSITEKWFDFLQRLFEKHIFSNRVICLEIYRISWLFRHCHSWFGISWRL